jgi:hypothetical protein
MNDSLTSSSKEPSKQFREIFEAHHDPEIQELKRMLRRKQERIQDKQEDLGIDITKTF